MQTTEIAGWHLTYDAVVSDEGAEKLGDSEFLRLALVDLAELVQLEIEDGPRFCLPLQKGDDRGIAGVGTFAGGHVNIRTWPKRARLSLDLFPCQEKQRSLVEDFLWERFSVEKRSLHWVLRLWL